MAAVVNGLPVNAIRSRAVTIVHDYCVSALQEKALVNLLSRPGFVLHPASKCRGGLFTLEVYRCVKGTIDEIGVEAAVAIELQMEAAFVFDDIADAPAMAMTQSQVGMQLALAIALLACSNAVANEVSWKTHPRTGRNPLSELQRDCIASCEGQYLDSRFQETANVSPDEALTMTRRKSGELGRLAAGFGARVATGPADTVRQFEEFGSHLFTYAQLVDDLRDACPEDFSGGDLGLGKKTVPVTLFLHSRRHGERATNDARIATVDIQREYEESEAALCGAMVAEVFLNRAKRALRGLKVSGFEVERLGDLLESYEQEPVGALCTHRLGLQAQG